VQKQKQKIHHEDHEGTWRGLRPQPIVFWTTKDAK